MDSMSIYNWLRVINLQQYTSLFLKAGYSNSAQCVHLTENDLARIGVTLAGHIRRILAHPPEKTGVDSHASNERVAADIDEAPSLPPKSQTSRSKETLSQLDRSRAVKPTPKPRRSIKPITPKNVEITESNAASFGDVAVKVPSSNIAAESIEENAIAEHNSSASTSDFASCYPPVFSPKPKLTNVSKVSRTNSDGLKSIKHPKKPEKINHEYVNDDEFSRLNQIVDVDDSYNDLEVSAKGDAKACSNDYHDYANELDISRNLDTGFSSSSESASQHQLSSPSDGNAGDTKADSTSAVSPDDDSDIYESIWNMQTHSESKSRDDAVNLLTTPAKAPSPLVTHGDDTAEAVDGATVADDHEETDNSGDSYCSLPPPNFAPPPLPKFMTKQLPSIPRLTDDALSTARQAPAPPPLSGIFPLLDAKNKQTPAGNTQPYLVPDRYTLGDQYTSSSLSHVQPISHPGSNTPISASTTSPVMSKSMFSSCSDENPFANADPFTDFTTECSQFNKGTLTATANPPVSSNNRNFGEILDQLRAKDVPQSEIDMSESMDVVKTFDPFAQSTPGTDTFTATDLFDTAFDAAFNHNDPSDLFNDLKTQGSDWSESRPSLTENRSVPHEESEYYNDSPKRFDDDIYENYESIYVYTAQDGAEHPTIDRSQPDGNNIPGATATPTEQLVNTNNPPDSENTGVSAVPVAVGDKPISGRNSPLNSRIPILASAPTVRLKERSGYLYKQGGFQGNKGWRKRWVVFNGADFRYYSENKSYVSKRVIPLTIMENIEADIKADNTRRFKFKLITKTRIYLFSTDTLTDNQLWTQTLMEAIITYRRTNPLGETLVGGKMANPDIEGYVRFDGIKSSSYLAIKKDLLCYYRTKEDYELGCPIHEIPMKLAGVKQLSKSRLQLSTHYQHFFLSFDSQQQMMQFKMAMEDSIADGLADDTVLNQVRANDSNHYCADCRSPNPHWAAINYGIVLCTKCAGIHRMFPRSRVRSLRMDTKVWTTSLVTIMFMIGNNNANSLLESDLTGDEEIEPQCASKQRQEHLDNKYQKRRFLKPHDLTRDRTALNEELLKSAQTDDILTTLHLILCGAEVLYHRSSSDQRTAYDLAKAAGQVLQMELLMHNGGDGSLKNRNSMYPEVKVRTSVTLQGYLYRPVSPPNFKGLASLPAGITNMITTATDTQKRWVNLEHGILSSFVDEKSSAAKDMLDCDKFVMISASTTDRHEYCFQVSSLDHASKMISFAADSHDDQLLWMQAIAKSFCPIPLMEHMDTLEFTLAGFFHVRDGLTEWILSWVTLSRKTLSVYREEQMEYDTRKIQSLATQDNDTCEGAREAGSCVAIVMAGHTLYMQADLPRDTECLVHLIQHSSTGSSGKLEDQQLTNKNIPVIVEKCISFIDIHGKTSEGIYRRSGTHSKVTQLFEAFKADARSVGLLRENYTEHDVANVLKRYFRSLDDPLLTRSLYDDWIEKASFSDHNTKLQWYKYLLCQMPKINYDTLKRLMGHLSSIAENQSENLMGVSQLSALFGPTLMTIDSDEVVQSCIMSGNTGREITVLTDIINSQQWLFEVDETETEKDRMIDDAVKKLRNLVERTDSGAQEASVTMIDVYVGNRQGECVTLKQVANDTTVAQVIKWVCSKASLQESSCAMYEIACSDSLERPLAAHGLIQDIIHEWQHWPDEDRRTVYLCVKSGDMVQFIHSLYDFHMPLFGEMKFSEKKSYKKLCVEFKQYKLTCFKDSRATNKIGEWEVERLSVYSGVEKKRNPPTEYGFTFIIKGEKMKRNRETPYFGKSVCCSTQEEAMNWMSGICKAQFPNGFHNT